MSCCAETQEGVEEEEQPAVPASAGARVQDHSSILSTSLSTLSVLTHYSLRLLPGGPLSERDSGPKVRQSSKIPKGKKYIYFRDWHCGVACKATTCDASLGSIPSCSTSDPAGNISQVLEALHTCGSLKQFSLVQPWMLWSLGE